MSDDIIHTYRSIPVNKIVEFDETPGFGPWKDLFSEASRTHPAKANLNMLRFLIEKFTSPGDVILDPMSGTGSTGTMANLQGRNAILVEYEEKFADMCKDNMEIVKKNPGLHKGSTVVIQGDARELSSILKEKVDFAMFSPPYAKQIHGTGQSRQKVIEILRKKGYDERWIQAHYTSDCCNVKLTENMGYSKDPDNIGNLPYKPVDTVLTSPPHGGAVSTPGDPKRRAERMKKAGLDPKTIVGGKARCGEVDWQYSDDEENLGNLPYGQVDSVLTSPPHGDAFKHSNQDPEKRLEKLIEVEKESVRKGQKWAMSSEKVLRKRLAQQDDGYSETPDNLGNLPYGKVDQVITSPPYLDARDGAKRTISSVAEDQKLGASQRELQKPWGPDGTNIGDLPMGEVDSVITSPPYSKANKGGGIAVKGYEGKHGKDEGLQDRHERRLTEDDDNISNLPHGDISTVLTSPPHFDTKSDWDRTSRAKKEGEEVCYSDEVGEQERGNIGNIHHYGKGDPLSHKYSKLPEGVKGIDTVLTSPPYDEAMGKKHQSQGDKLVEEKRVWNVYSDDKENVGNLKGKTYLEAMVRVYAESYAVLKPGGLMIIIVKNFVRNWKPIRLDTDTIKLCEHIGFDLTEHLYRRLKQKSFWIRNYETKFRKKFPDPKVPLPTAQFEDILVFKKPYESS